MAKFSFATFLLVLVVIASVDQMMVPKVDASTCQVTLTPTGCVLEQCRQDCLQMYNGNGVCVPFTTMTDFQCQCIYNC
ncbi:Defensin-like protein [Dioscorea alata]|uniref:Defensin-like protein n=1 Tax=Dioscorea alata TaxID=55571 RepID=A0ACB7VEW3_DIOAL|nr:Defensin-like protein [Dioscorea alata]